VLKREQILQNDCMFVYIHSTQKENWQLVGKVIVIHINFFPSQSEQKDMIFPNDKMTVTSLLCQLNVENLTGGMIKKEDQIEIEVSTPFINDLEMSNIFKNENDEKENDVIDKLITKIS